MEWLRDWDRRQAGEGMGEGAVRSAEGWAPDGRACPPASRGGARQHCCLVMQRGV